ncbi:Uncharacterised protein [Slackia heliotrinireducens]|uniref:Transcriptional regulator, tetR family n=1 Tax=Slackia heliotrinireducens (strain ATCC 29202 / DSM 20476 / NCTC 11029 / RHS 1) TaxID=471855 RepID=C7N7A5_SLAHD|nr:TetR/AcrR family transcriptional regulator [Slackia heliotrinireducens]ACV22790.1 hypothetical protein Shel_17710 [Slackia heliotrinireducens DSM 20476]VEH01482.1 Uncharacterised protein [Slackia heliotrinireducens]
MARKRNEETVAAIRKAAFEIMLESGYVACTYTELAKLTGIPRTTVQHYLPEKNMIANEFMSCIAELCLQHGRMLAGEDQRPVVVYFLTGQTSHGLYYSTPGLRQFLLDVSASRDLQYAVTPDFYDWYLQMQDIEAPDVCDSVQDAMTFDNGGVYEVHYKCIKDGRVPNIAFLNRRALETLAGIMGVSSEEFDDVVKRYSIDNDTLLKAGAELAAKLRP